jgi:hypothetical protein
VLLQGLVLTKALALIVPLKALCFVLTVPCAA